KDLGPPNKEGTETVHIELFMLCKMLASNLPLRNGIVSKMDEEDCERRRMECLDEMSNLEKQFTDLKDQLYRERVSQVNSKLAEVEAGRAAEYLEPLAGLLEMLLLLLTLLLLLLLWLLLLLLLLVLLPLLLILL
uniref:Uncharacterized protein n=1 Tax=Myripristis murdjan TaxID=586833 RepID=A0A667ZGA4_9TELE